MNKMNRFFLLFFGCAVLVSACSDPNSYLAISHVANWDFIQSVGGIRLGALEKKAEDSWVLPVVCDVSGLTEVTQKPTTMNSGLVVTRMLYHVIGNEIYISVALSLPLNTRSTHRCTEITLNGIKSGDYKILYGEPNKAARELGVVTLR